MTLDLDELTDGWNTPPGEMRARLVRGSDGETFIQIRLDLGLMQLAPSGRPDGMRYRGFPSACDYCEHELRVTQCELEAIDWAELERELEQFNYRRLAYSHLAEDALRDNDNAATRRYLRAALDDVAACQSRARLLNDAGRAPQVAQPLRPTLAFDQARLLTQWELLDGRFEEAVEQAEDGAAALKTLLAALGYEPEAIAEDIGVTYLSELSRKLRTEYGITQTLRERLAEAIEAEDFETAAELRDTMQRRAHDAAAGPTAEAN